jgi:hypothetical protein
VSFERQRSVQIAAQDVLLQSALHGLDDELTSVEHSDVGRRDLARVQKKYLPDG